MIEITNLNGRDRVVQIIVDKINEKGEASTVDLTVLTREPRKQKGMNAGETAYRFVVPGEAIRVVFRAEEEIDLMSTEKAGAMIAENSELREKVRKAYRMLDICKTHFEAGASPSAVLKRRLVMDINNVQRTLYGEGEDGTGPHVHPPLDDPRDPPRNPQESVKIDPRGPYIPIRVDTVYQTMSVLQRSRKVLAQGSNLRLVKILDDIIARLDRDMRDEVGVGDPDG